MSVTGKLFGNFFLALTNEEHDILDDTIKASLHTSGYTPDQDAHDYVNDLTNEVSGTGYTATGNTLASKTMTYTGATNKAAFDAADSQWATSTITARTAVIRNQTGGGTDATRGLIGYEQETVDISSAGGNWDLIFNASGIFEITVS